MLQFKAPDLKPAISFQAKRTERVRCNLTPDDKARAVRLQGEFHEAFGVLIPLDTLGHHIFLAGLSSMEMGLKKHGKEVKKREIKSTAK